MIQRDYIERLIEQCAEFLRRALKLRKAGELEPSLAVLREAGTRLDAADRTRIPAVSLSLKLRELDPRYHATLRHLPTGPSP